MKFSRLYKVLEVVKLILIFFERKVLNFGILKNKFFRLIFCILGFLIVGVLAVIMYSFWTNSDSTVTQTTCVIDVYSFTIIMWVVVAFLFMKILFMKTDSFIKFTIQLPVTGKEINLAVLIFEILLSLVFMIIVSASLVISLIAKYGVIFIPRILCNIVFTGIITYLVLECFYAILSYLIDILKLKKMKNVIMFCFIIVVFMILYVIGYQKAVDSVLFNYMDESSTSSLIVFSYIMEKTNLFVSAVIFVALASIIFLIIINIPNCAQVTANSYLKVRHKSCKQINMFKSYLINFFRGIDTYNYIFIVTFLFIFSLIFEVKNSVYSLLILSVSAVYSYVQTDGLRTIQIKKKYSVIKDYLYLILSQVLGIYLISIPFAITYLVKFNDWKSCITLYPIVILSSIIFTLVGIVFPPKRENPFSVIIGVLVMAIISILLLVALVIFNFNFVSNVIIMVIVVVLCIYYSIYGLYKLQLKERLGDIG